MKETGDYQHRAIRSPNRVQRFWHEAKLDVIRTYLVPGKRGLDVGCGSGNHLDPLSSATQLTIGLDANERALRFARSADPRRELVVADGRALPFASSSFDRILLLDVIEHLDDPEILLRELRRVLASGGILIVTTPNYGSYYALVERAAAVLSRDWEDDRHPSRMNAARLRALADAAGLWVETLTTIHHISPFVAAISHRMAATTLSWESRPGRRMGLLLLAVLKRPEDAPWKSA